MPTRIESLKLRPELVAACRKQGFREAMPIQALVVPVAMLGHDVVVEAKTGSGKTLAYGLPLLNAEPRQRELPEALVIAPTRELAEQIHAALERTRGTLERRIVLLTGRGGMDRQKAELEAGAAIVVGTMGRIEELVERNILRLSQVRTLVLDEVDELLRGGFSLNLAKLLERIPADRQTMLFSATVPHEVEQVAQKFMRKPRRLRLSAARELPAELAHRVLRTHVDSRVADLQAYLEAERPYQTLVFCGTRHEVEELQQALVDLELEAEYLHGELSALKRRQLMERFRSGELPILVASDLAARGLDLPGVDLVVNFSLPDGMPAYLHRAGRTGRAGRPGTVLSLLIEQQHGRFAKLQQELPFQAVEVRNGRVVTRSLKTREQRDQEFRRIPPRSSGDEDGDATAAPRAAHGRPRGAPAKPGARAGLRGKRRGSPGARGSASSRAAGKGSFRTAKSRQKRRS
ncbi:MAG: DEAD/DEAH box helicase [Myxococcales bacterium]